jgi:hypothetical protein
MSAQKKNLIKRTRARRIDTGVRYVSILIALCGLTASTHVHAQTVTPRSINGATLGEMADAVLALMGYSLTPDVTTGSLSIANAPTSNPNIQMFTLGGGFTWSDELPLYLEGTAGYSRYDPVFLVTDGEEQRTVESKWRSISAAGGVGWDFPLIDTLKLRPIANFSYGRVLTDGSIAGYVYEELTGEDIEFLRNGTLNARGFGGTLMLDYERYLPGSEIDIELRYTNIRLESTADSSVAVQGNSDAQTASLWSRWRAPIQMSMFGNPVRYVLEAAHSEFFGDLRGALGFEALTSFGVGLELDTDAHDIYVTRTRVMMRYQFGNDVEGVSLGMAVSF